MGYVLKRQYKTVNYEKKHRSLYFFLQFVLTLRDNASS